MEKVQKKKPNYKKYLMYASAIVVGVGLGVLFSQKMLSHEETTGKTITEAQNSTGLRAEPEDTSLDETNKLIAERAHLMEEAERQDSINKLYTHGQKILNPIEIEKLNNEVRNFDTATKAGNQNSDKLFKITWEMLKDVKFEERYFEEVQAHLLYPIFGESIKKMDGKNVYIRGFVIPADEVNNIYVLSANSYASCFFCGNAGPESVVDLDIELTPDLKKKLQLDAVFTFKGKLKLNSTDVDHLNYILEGAEVYEVD